MTLLTNQERLLSRNGDKRVVINVSGERFVTWQSTLKKHPDTLLGSSQLEYYYDQERKEYFIDRDPHLFRYVLNYYRVGKLHCSSEDTLCSFTDELKFYGVEVSELQDCCMLELSCEEKKEEKKEADLDVYKHYASHGKQTLRKKLCRLIEDETTKAGQAIKWTIVGMISLSIIQLIVETINCGSSDFNCGEEHPDIFFGLDMICMMVFTVEYLARFYSAPRRWQFFSESLNIVDLLAIIPFYFNLAMRIAAHPGQGEKAKEFEVLRVLRVLRILKLCRHSTHMRTMGTLLKRAMSDLGFLVFTFILIILVYSCLLYYMERDQKEGKFTNIVDTMWFVVVTIMTVGYGDIVPSTILGKIFSSICSLSGLIYLALLIPVLQGAKL